MQSIACAVVAAALFGTALVTTHSGLRHMDALSGARVSIPTATVLFWLLFTLALSALFLRGERLSGPLAAGVALTVAGVVVLLVQW